MDIGSLIKNILLIYWHSIKIDIVMASNPFLQNLQNLVNHI